MMHGIEVVLYERTQTEEDSFGAPVWKETPTTVTNVLVGQPSSEDVINTLQLSGKRIAYVLAIPKGDSHNWDNVMVEFFGQKWRTFGGVIQGMESMIPGRWNRQVKVERYE